MQGSGSLSASWTARASDGDAPVTSYTATASPGGASCTVPGTATTCTIAGVTRGTSYTVTVRATNSAGTGPASAPSDPVTAS